MLSNMTTYGMEALDDKNDKANFMGQCRVERIWEISEGAQAICLAALTIAAEGGKSDIAKPMKGLGSGVLEIALPHRGNAFRVVYAVQLGADLWVLHAFQKKSTQGIKTPQREIDAIR